MSNDPTMPLDDFQQLMSVVRSIDKRLQGFETRLENLERTVSERLYDTKPIWPVIERKLEEINTRLKKVENDVAASRDSIENRLDEIEKVSIKTRSDMLDLRTDFRALRAKIKERFPDMDISFTPGVQ